MNTNDVEQPRHSQLRRKHVLSRTPKKSFLTVFSNSKVIFLLAAFCFLECHRPCYGSENAASSFQRPPPPPSGVPLSPPSDDDREETRNNGYSHMGLQQGIPPPPPSQYQDEYYTNSGETREVPRNSERVNPALKGQQRQNSAVPIHYEFPIAESDSLAVDGDGQRRRINNKDGIDDQNRDFPKTSSARNDLVMKYWSTKTGKVQIQTVVGLVGYGSGSFVAKSIIGGSEVVRWTGYTWASILIASTWFRTPMGELSRAVGLSLILVLQRTQRIRREYPTWRYVGASLGISRGRSRGPRPFPPARNPWRYNPRSQRDPDFNMMYALVSMAMVGSTVGGNLPLIPNWIGALVGAASFAFACTWQNSPRGDLARTMGMRVVRAVSELWEIQADLQIIPKATVVSSQVIDKAMVLDRKHKVKDRFLSFANKSYAQASKVAEQIQNQQRGGNNKERDDIDNYQGPRGYSNVNDRRGNEDYDLKTTREQGRDQRRDNPGSGRYPEYDRDYEHDDDKRHRLRHKDSDNDQYGARDKSKVDERQRNGGRFEVEINDFVGRSTSSRHENYGFGERREPLDENESDKKSRGFFFRRK